MRPFGSSRRGGCAVAALLACGLLGVAPASAAEPPNDDFAAAAVLSAGETSTVDTTDASLEVGEPVPCQYVSHSIWYSFTPPGDGWYQVDTLTTVGVDTVVAVYEGTIISSLSELACGYDSISSSAKVVTPLTGGTTYYIQVSGDGSSEGGTVTTAVTAGADLPTEPPYNDRMDSPRLLLPGSQVVADNTHATTDSDDSRFGPPAGCEGQASLWFIAWSRDFANRLVLDTSGSAFDSGLLVVEVGVDVEGVWCASGGGAGDDARLQILTTPGRHYYVRVASEGASTGAVHLSAGTSAAPDAPTAVQAVRGDRSARSPGSLARPTALRSQGSRSSARPAG